MKKVISILFLASIFLSVFSTSAMAATPYKSYNYIRTNSGVYDVASPDGYVPENVFTYENLGIPVGTYEDIYIDSTGTRYIVDSKNNCFYVFDANYKLQNTISKFMNKDSVDTFNEPTGICVLNDDIYISDSKNARIVVLKKDGTLNTIINKPSEDVLVADFEFVPLKIAVSDSGRIFVVAKGVYEGLMELTFDGKFLGYIGSNKVVANPIDIFWKKIFTQQQNKASKSFIPVEYTNISLDRYGFVYAVTSVKNVDAPIKRLNPSGNDILVRKSINKLPVIGDIIYNDNFNSTINGPSTFVDIIADDKYGIFYALDSKRGRIFTYDSEGNILSIFGGGQSDQRGTFFVPSAIELDGDKILVLEKQKSSLTIFKKTDYTKLLSEAILTYDNGDYEKSLTLWDEVLKKNNFLNFAYIKTGYCLYRLGDYKGAMDNFIVANAREQYSKAFVKYSRQNLEQMFPIYATIFLAIVIIIAITIYLRNKKKKQLKSVGRKMNESV